MPLNYGERIPNGEYMEIKEDDIESAVDNILRIICDKNLDYLRGIRGPKDFLRHTNYMIGNLSDMYLFDTAISYYLIDDYDKCLSLLTTLTSDRPGVIPQAYIQDLSKKIIGAIHKEPFEVKLIIENIENENIDKFSLRPSL